VEGEVLRQVEKPSPGPNFERSILPIAFRAAYPPRRPGAAFVGREALASERDQLALVDLAGFAGTTKAVTSSPHASLACRRPQPQPRWDVFQVQLDLPGYTLKPPEMISSLSRPRIASVPSSPISPTSPVRKKTVLCERLLGGRRVAPVPLKPDHLDQHLVELAELDFDTAKGKPTRPAWRGPSYGFVTTIPPSVMP